MHLSHIPSHLGYRFVGDGCSGQRCIVTKSFKDVSHTFACPYRVVHEFVDSKVLHSSCQAPSQFADDPCFSLD